MKVAYLTCIKDEEELIYYNLIYYYNVGIRDFYIMFNNSNQETINQVERFKKEKTDCRCHIEYDSDYAFRQPIRFTKLANFAYEEGCDWMISIDADEIVQLPKHTNIQDALLQYDNNEFGFIVCNWIDYQATSKDNFDDINYFTKWKYRNANKRPVSKVIVKWHPDMKFGDGHHLVTSKRKDLGRSTDMIYAHFPCRTYKQYKNKIEVIAKAFILAFGEESKRPQIAHYHAYSKKGEAWFQEKWERIEKYRQTGKFIYDPLNEKLFK